MRFIKKYKRYIIKSDGRDDYLCYRGIRVRMFPHTDKDFYIEGNNATEAEKTIKFAMNRKQGPHQKSY